MCRNAVFRAEDATARTHTHTLRERVSERERLGYVLAQVNFQLRYELEF